MSTVARNRNTTYSLPEGRPQLLRFSNATSALHSEQFGYDLTVLG
jgi:hypothetical protein